MRTLDIICPVFNEEESVKEFYVRLTSAIIKMKIKKYAIIFVDDGSTDNTLKQIEVIRSKNKNVHCIQLGRNFGSQIAIQAGLDHSMSKYSAIIDGDLQDPPELLVEMYNTIQTGYDNVYALRKSRKGESLFKRYSASLFYRLLKSSTEIEIPVDTGDFRIINRKIVNYLQRMKEQNKFLRGQIAWIGLKSTFVEYDRDNRVAGRSGYSIQKMWKLAWNALTSFSTLPLQFAVLTGLLFSLTAFCISIYVLYARFASGDYERGWPSIMISVLFLGGVQLLSIGIIGQYLARTAIDVRERPLYTIQSSTLKNNWDLNTRE